MQKISLCFLFLFFAGNLAQAQPDARTFQNFFLEGSQMGRIYGDVGLEFSDYNRSDVIYAGGRLGLPIGRAVELGVGLNFINIDRDFGDERSGLSDIPVTGRYLVSGGDTDISVGGRITLPVGDKDVGQGDVDITIFGALRHYASNDIGITGVFGVDFFDQNDDYEASLRLGGGVVYVAGTNLQLLGELNFLTDPDYALLSFGVDYMFNSGARLRPALGIGLDDGAPDFVLYIRILFL